MEHLVIDVREADEFSENHVKSAINIPTSELNGSKAKLTDVPKDARIVVYCRSGQRAGQAQRILQSWGYLNVSNGVNQENVEVGYGL